MIVVVMMNSSWALMVIGRLPVGATPLRAEPSSLTGQSVRSLSSEVHAMRWSVPI